MYLTLLQLFCSVKLFWVKSNDVLLYKASSSNTACRSCSAIEESGEAVMLVVDEA